MSILYVDTSALLKRVIVERESSAVRGLLRRRNAAGDLLTTSSLAWLEVWRALRRLGLSNVLAVQRRAMSGIADFPLDEQTLVHARNVGRDQLRTLGAIHLAAALEVGADSVLTYDDRLSDSCAAAGLAILAPGREREPQ